jgi:hypothetical protein
MLRERRVLVQQPDGVRELRGKYMPMAARVL